MPIEDYTLEEIRMAMNIKKISYPMIQKAVLKEHSKEYSVSSIQKFVTRRRSSTGRIVEQVLFNLLKDTLPACRQAYILTGEKQ